VVSDLGRAPASARDPAADRSTCVVVNIAVAPIRRTVMEEDIP
jgi:hypothetical protein